MDTTMNLQILLNTAKLSYPEKYFPNFLTQESPGIENFDPSKISWSSLSLEIRSYSRPVPPPPPPHVSEVSGLRTLPKVIPTRQMWVLKPLDLCFIPLLSRTSLQTSLDVHGISNLKYCKIPKISPEAYFFQRPFLRGLFLERPMYWWKFAFQNRLGYLLVGRKFTIFALFYFVFEGKFQVQAPRGGLYLEGWFNVRFCLTILGDLYLEGLIFGILR